MKQSRQRLTTFATVVLAVAALSTAPAIAGNGNGNGNGNGKGGINGASSAEAKLLKTNNKGGAHSSGHGGGQGGGFGALASELKKMNGAIHASFKAWTNASLNGVPGQARTYAESNYDGDLVALQDEASLLGGTLTLEDYNAKIDKRIVELDPADFEKIEDYDAEVARLTDLKYTELPDGEETIARLDEINTELTGSEALNSLTGGRTLSKDAMDVFEARVDEYLASKETEGDVLLTEEDPPVE